MNSLTFRKNFLIPFFIEFNSELNNLDKKVYFSRRLLFNENIIIFNRLTYLIKDYNW